MKEKIVDQLMGAGMSVKQSDVKGDLFQSAMERLKPGGSDRSVHAFYVPGRIEFLGKHTDYAGGRSLICAVDRGFCMVACSRPDRVVRVLGETAETSIAFELQTQIIPRVGHWSNYPMTVGLRIARNFPGNLFGADISFTSDLPQSSGLSSSSAMIIAFFMAFSAVNRLSDRDEYRSNIRTTADLAGYLGTIENGQTFGTLTGDRGVGTFGGSQDHTAILVSVAGQLSQYSFCPVRHERQIQLPKDFIFVIGVSGVIAEKTGAAQAMYNNISLQARTIVDHWNKMTGHEEATLAAVASDSGELNELRGSLQNPELIARLDQFVFESFQIIPAAGAALIEGRLDDLGLLVDRSQDLANRLLKNQISETDYLAKSACDCGAVAASSFGAGFGGSVWALVRSDEIDPFIARWQSRYQTRFPHLARQAAFFPAAAGIPAMSLAT